MLNAKPFAESCEQNKGPILTVLREVLREPGTVLEIGSGTGQHAVYFAAALSHLIWQPSDVAANLPGIEMWCQEQPSPNLLAPIELDVAAGRWPEGPFDAVFSANTAHIMAWSEVQRMFDGVGQVLRRGGRFCLYGPFNYDGRYTAPSNERFDAWLRQRDPAMGVRDFRDLQGLAQASDLTPIHDFEMPADNRTLVWEKN